MPVTLVAVATASGASATGNAKRFGFQLATTDPKEILEAADIDAVVIATRHGSHADLAAAALAAGKHVFVEKPLALTRQHLAAVLAAWQASDRILSVGFNRRFAPLIVGLRAAMRRSGPITSSYVVNVAAFPAGSWILDPEEGGGVVMAEGGHFIDTTVAFVGEPPVAVTGRAAGSDSYVATLEFADGSLGAVTYTTRGGGQGPKELLTVAGRGVFAELHDFRTLSLWPGGKRGGSRSRQDKGHQACLTAWVDAVAAGTDQPVSIGDIAGVAEATIAVADSIRLGTPIAVDPGALRSSREPSEG
jgi:predicted dehydrogenase